MRVTTYKIKEMIASVQSSPNKRKVTVQYKRRQYTVEYVKDKRSNYVLCLVTGYALLKRIVTIKG